MFIFGPFPYLGASGIKCLNTLRCKTTTVSILVATIVKINKRVTLSVFLASLVQHDHLAAALNLATPPLIRTIRTMILQKSLYQN